MKLAVVMSWVLVGLLGGVSATPAIFVQGNPPPIIDKHLHAQPPRGGSR